LRKRGKAAIQLYGLLSDLYEQREKLYSEKHIIRRWKRFRTLVHQNAYNGSGSYTFSRKGMIKDLALAIFFAPILKTRGFASTGGDPTCRIVIRSPSL
jgi:hypothetical protein